MNTYPTYDEITLLQQVSRGDENAFRTLFYQYHQKLGAYIFKLTGSFALAEEVVQDVFLKIWQHRSALATIQHFEPYLFVIARNHAFNCLKQIAREKTRIKEWAGRQETATEGAPGSPLTGYDTLIDKAIDKLPPQQRKVYQLHYQDGMKYLEIALRLGLSPGTVKKHMTLALRSIREYIATHV